MTENPPKKPRKGSRVPGSGRAPGTTNHMPRELKEMIFEALHRAGGVEYLLRQARKSNPRNFLSLVGRCLPRDVNVSGGLTLAELVRQAIAPVEKPESTQPPATSIQ